MFNNTQVLTRLAQSEGFKEVSPGFEEGTILIEYKGDLHSVNSIEQIKALKPAKLSVVTFDNVKTEVARTTSKAGRSPQYLGSGFNGYQRV